MREIVLDTETTGLEPNDGHRIIEIGAVELFNHVPTGRVFHTYVNPGRDVPAEALRVHGLTSLRIAKPHMDWPDDPGFVDDYLDVCLWGVVRDDDR